jgi:Tol biopolymer transport system component
LTDEPIKHFSPIWSPDGNTLYFTKGADNFCSIWQTDISLGFKNITYQKITDCGDLSSMSPIAVDKQNEWLYFSKIVNKKQFVITRYNLVNGIEEPLSIPGSIGFGDYSISLSPDNQWLAFVRNTSTIKKQLVLLNLHTKEIDILSDFYQVLFKLSWERDSHHIWFLNEKNQSNRLNIFTKQIDKTYQFQHKALAPYNNHKSNYIIDGGFFLSEIVSFDFASPLNDKNYTVDISSSFSDYAPAPNNDLTAIAFTSKRSGIQQIWIKEVDELKQLTNFNLPSVISEKHVSPSGEQILFLKNQKLHIIDIDSQQISDYFSTILAKSPIWSCDGNSIFVVFEENDSENLYRLNTNHGVKEKLFSDIISIKQDCSTQKLYVMQSSQKKVFQLRSDTLDLIDTGITEHTTFPRNWSVQNDEFILLRENKLTKTSLTTLDTKAIKLPQGAFKYFQFTNNRIFLSRRLFKETSIKQIVEVQ